MTFRGFVISGKLIEHAPLVVLKYFSRMLIVESVRSETERRNSKNYFFVYNITYQD